MLNNAHHLLKDAKLLFEMDCDVCQTPHTSNYYAYSDLKETIWCTLESAGNPNFTFSYCSHYGDSVHVFPKSVFKRMLIL